MVETWHLEVTLRFPARFDSDCSDKASIARGLGPSALPTEHQPLISNRHALNVADDVRKGGWLTPNTRFLGCIPSSINLTALVATFCHPNHTASTFRPSSKSKRSGVTRAWVLK